jgi:hypothetical protein
MAAESCRTLRLTNRKETHMNPKLIRRLVIMFVLSAGLLVVSSTDTGQAFDDEDQITYEQCMMLGGSRTLLLNGQCVCSVDWKSYCLEVGNTWDDYTCTCSPAPQLCSEVAAVRCSWGGGTFLYSSCSCQGGGVGYCYSSSYENCQFTGGTWDPSSCSCNYWYGGPTPSCNRDQSVIDACSGIPGAHWDNAHCQCLSPV